MVCINLHCSEKEILREGITSLEIVRDKLQLRVSELEEEVRKIRRELEEKNNQSQQIGEDEEVRICSTDGEFWEMYVAELEPIVNRDCCDFTTVVLQ